MTSLRPLEQLLKSRLREFFREPEAIFWVYGFPVLLAVGLGIAFREKPPEQIRVDLAAEASAPAADRARAALSDERFVVSVCSGEECAARLRMGRSDLYVVAADPVQYVYDAMRPESILARARVDEALQRQAGRTDPVATHDRLVTEPGSRYIDFLIPGLLGMNLMGGGLWGVGFVIVDMRVRRLLKRLVATPMRKSHFLIAMVGSRLIFMLPEMALLLLAGSLFFQVVVRGSLLAVTAVTILGAVSFAGLGLLVACRAQKIETVAGLMNVVMLPMWLLSGIFFSSDRFPQAIQPAIKALPLTLLNDALRAVILEGAPILSQAGRLAGLAAWGVVSFALALRWFRWN
ncbi:MAG: ABC transporter permease [Candidatus Polarisedimenticolia bacterium]